MKKILLGSNNKKKLHELEKLLAKSDYNIVTAKDLGITLPDVVEDGSTYEENAAKKALAFNKFSGLPAIADDSGLEVDALDGEPGIYSGRWSGENGENQSRENNKKLLTLLQGVPFEKRTAKFVCVIVLAVDGEVKITTRGECPGVIIEELRGQGGFGYDPLFFLPKYDKTFAELTEVKSKISHRAIALKKFEQKLSSL
ncbi:RdgB/HAM1 family non-canonical purine NTP pyrophosphatase [Candidatus Uabimicrobium amorphum]|uniref:dITP/XTP pyrophosphatase n=1 Tax=Uabimicrobium amorphum TaxID=2596890 RepID=A0A5S9F117_UABAM|nr:RdgB/HAM1 family non-canonical purine NTP pyrophosphatase [Candidatus Uabimicrobium amorphum]BBM81938.1 non-canonical purine NTP pyrophosphatase [Candidatus Uabimicrobium amorphum]